MNDVTIEPLAPGEFELVASWLVEGESNQWLTSDWRGRPVDRTLIAVAVRNKKNLFFLVKCGGTAAGLAALADIDPVEGTAMVWYVLGEKRFLGRGVTTSAVRQLIGRAIGDLGLESIYAWIMEDNLPSRRVLEKAGFREAGRLRSAASHAGKRVARVYFDLTKEDLADPQLAGDAAVAATPQERLSEEDTTQDSIHVGGEVRDPDPHATAQVPDEILATDETRHWP